MKLALVLNAVNPRLGGVLIRGEKGTAKSTAARALARACCRALDGRRRLPLRAATRGPRHRAARTARARPAAGRGSTSAPAVVRRAADRRDRGPRARARSTWSARSRHGERHFEPGLLARANRGLLYVDEVNLLPDHLVDVLLDAAAMGINSVEREGVSFSHPARVHPGRHDEPGGGRPAAAAAGPLRAGGRGGGHARAGRARRGGAPPDRLRGRPGGFAARWQAGRRRAARAHRGCARALPSVRVDDRLLDSDRALCTDFEVDGLRADIVMYKTAATLAAYAGRSRGQRRRRARRRRAGPAPPPPAPAVRSAGPRPRAAGPVRRGPGRSDTASPDGEPAPDQVFEVGAPPPITPPPDRERPRADPSLRTSRQAHAPAARRSAGSPRAQRAAPSTTCPQRAGRFGDAACRRAVPGKPGWSTAAVRPRMCASNCARPA